MRARIGFTGLTTAVLLAAVSGNASAQDTTRVAPDSLRDTTAVAPAPAVSDTTASGHRRRRGGHCRRGGG